MTFVTNYREFNDEKTAPSLGDAVNEKEIPEKAEVLRYMKSFEDDVVCPGKVYDVVRNEVTTVPLVYYTDGEFVWDERDIYHFENYNLKLEEKFIQKVLKQNS